MIGFEILINNVKACSSSIESQLGVLSSIITWVKNGAENNEEISISVSGLDSKEGHSLKWLNQNVKVNDEILIKIIDQQDFDAPYSIEKPEVVDDIVIQNKLKYFYKLKEELKDYL